MTLFDTAQDIARHKLGLSTDYEIYFLELLPHSPKSWEFAMVKLGVQQGDHWYDRRHFCKVDRAALNVL